MTSWCIAEPVVDTAELAGGDSMIGRIAECRCEVCRFTASPGTSPITLGLGLKTPDVPAVPRLTILTWRRPRVFVHDDPPANCLSKPPRSQATVSGLRTGTPYLAPASPRCGERSSACPAGRRPGRRFAAPISKSSTPA